MLKYKKIKKNKILFLIALTLIAFLWLPISTKASDTGAFVITVTSSDGSNIDSKSVGIAVNWNGRTYIISDMQEANIYAFQDSSENSYKGMNACENPAGVNDGLMWFTPAEELAFTPGSIIQATIGEKYNIVYYDNDGNFQTGSLTISEYEAVGSFYKVTKGNIDAGEGYYPGLICDDSGNIVGYSPSANGAVLFEEPTGGDTGGDSSGDDSSGDDSSGNDSSGNSSSDQNNGASRGESSVLLCIIIGAIVGLIVRVIIKRKKNNNKPVQEQKPTPVKPVVSADTSDDIKPTTPVPNLNINKPVNDLIWSIRVNGFEYSIDDGLLIGRNPECDVRFPENAKGVSRRHCRIFIESNNLFVMDLDSSYGTFLGDNMKLTPNKPQRVFSGDTVYLGGKNNAILIICR